MSTERAVIYVESGTSLRSSSVEKHQHSHQSHQLESMSVMGGSNYVIKIQIGEEPRFNPVRIDVSTGRHLALKTDHQRHCPCEEESSSSGQSSPRSDMTPPPRMNLNLGPGGGNRFGSETSESDTESDISAEFRPLVCKAAQFAMREICEAETPSPPLPRPTIKKQGVVVTNKGTPVPINAATPPPLPITKAPPSPTPSTLMKKKSEGEVMQASGISPPEPIKTIDRLPPKSSRPPLSPKESILGAIMTLSESMALKRAKAEENKRLEEKKIDVDEAGFHVNEMECFISLDKAKGCGEGEESLSNFAGVRDIFSRKGEGTKQILSDKGTIRGVKNRVRDGIATFLQSKDTKTYSEKEQGRVVVYTTSMGVVRTTFQRCQKVKQILRNLLVKFDERDCYMNRAIQNEIRLRLPHPNHLLALPQVFLEGQLLGDAEVIEKLNETGELRNLLKPYKSLSVLSTCEKCGGFRMLPCQICNGSKKSVHRNHFTTEFIALKCMSCDPSGLVRCDLCNAPDS